VTPQFRSNYIYAGAVLSPDAGDRTERAKQLQPMVARHMIRPAEVQTSINPQTVRLRSSSCHHQRWTP
ncbi:unnamed protein product, partial [Symbiodinium sp. KB8]